MLMEMLANPILKLDVISLENPGDSVGKPMLHVLSHMSIGKKRILEIGTSEGQTIINMAKFSADDAVLYTIDINQKKDRSAIAGYPWFKKIKFIECDSKLLDFKSLNEQFDLVFIDGEHSMEAVINDTMKSLEVLAPTGKILWHDMNCPSVLLGVYYTGLQFGMSGNLGVSEGKRGASPQITKSTLVHIKRELEAVL